MKKPEIYHNPAYPLDDEAYGYNTGNLEFKYRKMTQNRPAKSGEHKGKVKIEIQVNKYQYIGTGEHERTRFYINTNIWVDPKNWSNKTQKLHPREDNSEYKSNVINNTYAAVVGYISSKGQQEINQPYVEAVDFSKLREAFPNRKENRKTCLF